MRRVLLENLPEPDRPARIPEAEARHLLNVLRLKAGDTVEAINGRGHAIVAKLRVAGEEAWLDFVEKREGLGGKVALHLELAILKSDAMSWVIEKAVEIGIASLTPVIAEHCVVKLNKSPEEFRDRWQRIADQALKQCGRLDRMTVEEPRALASLPAAAADRPRLFCDEAARSGARGLLEYLGEHPGRELHLLIGPEGGWSADERQKISRQPGTITVSLGPNVLRAETAALFAVAVAASTLLWPAGLAEFGRKS